ncbi:hypothetical protein BDQ94DRAFT_133897, partial [Aspergillus welwitschiae]
MRGQDAMLCRLNRPETAGLKNMSGNAPQRKVVGNSCQAFSAEAMSAPSKSALTGWSGKDIASPPRSAS